MPRTARPLEYPGLTLRYNPDLSGDIEIYLDGDDAESDRDGIIAVDKATALLDAGKVTIPLDSTDGHGPLLMHRGVIETVIGLAHIENEVDRLESLSGRQAYTELVANRRNK